MQNALSIVSYVDMSQNHEFGESTPNPWQLGEKLQVEAAAIERFLAHRDINSPTTRQKVAHRLGELSAEYANTTVYANSPLLLVPTEEGVGLGVGDVSGKLLGFSCSFYPTISEEMEAGPDKLGIIALIGGVKGINTVTDEASDAWRLGLLEGTGIKHEDVGAGFVIGMPITPHIRMGKLSDETTMPETVVELLQRTETAPPSYDYREYVEKIKILTQERAIATGADRVWVTAMHKELKALNDNCTYLGRSVEVEADLIRVPNPDKAESMLKLRGKVSGVLRKFVYQPYQNNEGVWKGSVQAVLYQKEVYDMVAAGELTPQLVDETLATFVVLNEPHQLTVLT